MIVNYLMMMMIYHWIMGRISLRTLTPTTLKVDQDEAGVSCAFGISVTSTCLTWTTLSLVQLAILHYFIFAVIKELSAITFIVKRFIIDEM